MRLEVRGHPLHTRALGVTLVQRADGKLEARGYLLDLRKRGLVPVAADLQGPGVIHHMLLDAVVDRDSRVLEELVARQPSVAFEPSEATQGESCRDPAARIEVLRGSVLDEGYARRLSGAIGGPRGCSHILTLAQMLGSAARWALDHDAGGERRPGERLFKRDIAIDGHEPEDRRVDMAVQLTDIHFAPSSASARPMVRFGEQYEMRGLVRIDLATLAIDGAEIAERRRGFDDIDTATWNTRDEIAGSIVGRSIVRGISPVLLERLGANPADAPVYDALLMMAPTMIQCFATMSDAWLAAARGADSLIGMGGMPDSCYMWRRDGALDQARRPGDPSPVL